VPAVQAAAALVGDDAAGADRLACQRDAPAA
jgi:hypothetical protein